MRTEELDSWLRGPREDLARTLGEAIAAHVQELRRQAHNFFGYAVSFGLERNLAAPFAITGCEEDLPTVESDLNDYYRYGANEWKHWWQDAESFAGVRRLTDAYETRFAELHEGLCDPEALAYSAWEQRHHALHQETVLQALRSARSAGVFAPTTFLQIHISGSHWDEELSIVERSVRLLNKPEHVQRYMQEFG